MEDHTFAADSLVEERVVVMHPPCGGNPTLRKAHFLKPLFSEDHTHLPDLPSPQLCSKPISENLKNYSLRSYKNYPSEKWKIWVHSLRPKYEEIWKQAGVYEAILASTYEIPRDKELIMGLAERWCGETNTFVFSWGEVTITLEDVMFLGGFSVLGALYLTPLADECVGIFDSLKKVRSEIRLLCGKHVNCAMWMEYFMCSGKELEHEAFLAMWLSRFVLLNSNEDIVVCNFDAAIHLSRGNRIALAPVVLASIYKDMRVLHNSIIESIDIESKACSIISLCHLDLVHMWAWERFSELRPTPGVMGRNEPRSARWNGVKLLEVKDVRVVLNSTKESFIWRPYVITPSNCMLRMLYKDSEQWLVVESDDIESYARCLRVSELVGINNIEQYLPHRVAMQFGLDQDVPPDVIRSNKSPKSAWGSYTRSLKGTECYIPPRLFESDVSSRYVVWWRGLLPVNEEMVTTCNQNVKHFPLISWGYKRRHSRHRTLLTAPSSVSERPDDYVEQDSLTAAQVMSRSRKAPPKKKEISRKIKDLYDEPVLQINFETESPEKLICRTKSVISIGRSISSSTKRPINLKKHLKEDAVVSKANCPETDVINLEDETCAHTDTLVEEREVIMCPPGGGNLTLRTAHFLKPIFSEHQNHLPSPPTSPFSSKSTSENIRKYKLHSKAYPLEKWKIWVHSLKPKYQEVWKQAGIYEAIMTSTYGIPKNKDLIYGLAERWCAETNTFIFPWGEATITLEDVMFLGGYSVLGALYLTPLADESIYEALRKAYKEVRTSCCGNASAPMWMEYFMFSGKQFEHEAFLAMWLSTFVLIRCNGKIIMKDFHVAIHLSRGNRIALAPVVLASIYKDMRLLQNSIVGSTEVESKDRLRFTLCHVDIVQMWVLERFPKLRPTPSVMEWAEPRSAHWNGVKILKVKDVRAALDSGKESFIWRPYVITPSNSMQSKLNRESEQWIVVESDDIQSFARCLRVSELVGLDNIEQYLPHRVAMQFGLDQDIPPHVLRSNECPKTAWRSYNRSFKGTKIYIPPRFYESDYSSRYVVWWRDQQLVNKKMVTTCIQNEKYLSLISWGQKRRRSRKRLSPKSKRFGKGYGPADMLILKTHSGNETPARRFGMTKPLISSVQSMSSSDKIERSSSAERLVSLKEDAVVNNTNHAEASNVDIKLAKQAVVSNANCLQDKTVNINEESSDKCTSELPHLELMARILRLEAIVDAIKAAKLDASLVDIETVVLDRT